MSKRKPPAEQIRSLRETGRRIGAPPGEWVLKTFEVEETRYKEFRALVEKENYLIKEAHDEALALWIAQHRQRKKPRP